MSNMNFRFGAGLLMCVFFAFSFLSSMPSLRIRLCAPPSPSQLKVEKSSPLKDASNQIKDHTVPINFMHTPSAFVKTIQSCETDSRCRLMFHHVGKTGGSTVEAKFDALWNDGKHLESCCGNSMVHKVEAKPEIFCKPKFTAYQVNAEQFSRIVDICVNQYPSTPPRVVILTTFREPVQLSTSYIHQMCNKHREARTPRQLEACGACQYENYTDVWDSIANSTSNLLQDSWEVSRLVLGNNTSALRASLPPDTTVLAMETNDITDFFAAYDSQHKMRPSNPERLAYCNFHVPSAMMRRLKEGGYYYRQLVANKDYE